MKLPSNDTGGNNVGPTKKNPGCKACEHIRRYFVAENEALIKELCGSGGVKKHDPMEGEYTVYRSCVFKNKNNDCPDFKKKGATTDEKNNTQ